MFIDRQATPLRLRSEERTDSWVVMLYSASAPPNGVILLWSRLVYKHLTPNGVKHYSDDSSRNRSLPSF